MRFGIDVLNTLQIYNKRLELALDWPINLYSKLAKYEPHLVIFDGLGLAYLPGLCYTKVHNVQSVFWNSNCTYESIRALSGFVYFLKKRLIASHDYYITGVRGPKEYISEHGISSKDIHHVEFTIDTKSIKNLTLVKHPKIPDDYVNLLFVGALENRKGLDVLLAALSGIDVQYKLVVVGEGEKMEEYIKGAHIHKIDVEFLGFVEYDDIYTQYAKADVVIVPSRREPWGLVVAEALASGLNVIASNKVGSKYLIESGMNGAVFESESSEQLKDHIRTAYHQLRKIRASRTELAEAFCADYNVDSMAAQFLSVIERV